MTKIEWTEETWNPVTGCTACSPGCDNCYARRMANRLRGRFGYPADKPFDVTFHEGRLEEPLHWRKPRLCFVCSMSDLFHHEVKRERIDRIFTVMGLRPRSTFQILTKRPKRMLEYTRRFQNMPLTKIADYFGEIAYYDWGEEAECAIVNSINMKLAAEYNIGWPFQNVWLGATVCTQKEAEEKLPDMWSVQAAVKFLSIEPMLEPIDLDAAHDEWWESRNISWVIVGGETGPGARYMDPAWARKIRDQCRAVGVPFFFKQMSGKNPIPKDLQIRKYP